MPEEPEKGKSTFLPPTSAEIVIANFISSIKEKNTENYKSCFLDEVGLDLRYIFIPSPDALTRFPSVFNSWTIENERSAFFSLVIKMPIDKAPELTLTNSKLDLMNDSALYSSDYFLKINHNLTNLPVNYAGTLQFLILRRSNGFWYIQRWLDSSPYNDTVGNSWSILKALLVN
jgi:hypothetical protein